MADFDKAFRLVVLAEGIDKYTNDPDDNGGATKFGITRKTLSGWLKRQATIVDVQNLTLAIAKQIYRKEYWDRIGGDKLPWIYALLVFDASINSGVKTASMWLQNAVGATPDGMIGDATIAAVQRAKAHEAIPKMVATRLKLMAGHEDYVKYGNGWFQRVVLKVMQAASGAE